ncbi:MAG: Aminoacyl-tRNA hydrolase, peptidyl-tRNA hydrolase, family [Candidatus Nomurabacteria bacterium]|nr:Aminoacyl-tRNA hydrolase, peptidyl-tRNA hydrolase, family [Candidatus Nomurabacteria bacterium]
MIYTLVPLGNPGTKYERTRHNIARILVKMIKDELESVSSLELFVPVTFMNESGKDVSRYLRYNEGRQVIVMYDDKDLPYGTFRISHDRGDGGHNGLKSIIEYLGKKDFTRIRIGIAPADTDGKEKIPPHGEEVQDYVLGKVTDGEENTIKEISPKVLEAIKAIVADGYQKAMEKFNGK